MKTTFSRQFALIAALLLVCMIFTGVSFRFLMLRYLKNDKKETLSADAQAVASLAEAYDSTGELEENWDFRLSLSLFSDVGEAEAQVCDENGFVVLCSCDEFNCEHLGRQIDADLITEIDMNGETFRVGTLTGIHDGRRYIAGRPIVSDDTEQGSVSQFFHILGSVDQTRGCCQLDKGEYEITIYTSCCNADRGIYYYTTYENHQITAVDMYRENLDSDRPVHYPLVQGEHILLQNAAAGSAEENQ